MARKYKIGKHEIPLVSSKEANRLIKDGAHIITREDDGACDFCGKTEELRPYGPKGEWICFECGMKDEAAAQRGFEKRFKAKRT